MNLVGFYDLLPCPFRIYLRSWESKCVSLWNCFWNRNQEKGTTLNLSFHQFGPCMCQCQPPSSIPHKLSPQILPVIVCLVADGALRCPTAKASWRNRAIVKIILGQNTGQNPKLVLLQIAWLSSFYHVAFHGETLLVQRPMQMTNNHGVLHPEKCKGEMELIDFCKALDTWI